MPIVQTAKQAAISVAKQVARESNEVLRTASQQILASPEQSGGPQPQRQESKPQINPEQEAAAKEGRLKNMMQSYNSELNEIRRDNLFKELQRKISEGEEIPLEDYIKELSSEQREVLKAQMEAIKMQKNAAIARRPDSIPQIISKKARGMIGTVKKRNQQHVESQKMPSN